MKDLVIAGKKFKSRFFLGTGKFASKQQFAAALEASETELVTTALTRVDIALPEADDILGVIDRNKIEVMLNTSGARNAEEAIRIAKLGKAAGYNWIKLEIHPDAHYLLPDPIETLKAAEAMVKMGLIVLPYINADPVLAHRLEECGTAAVMPLGSPIGSNQGIRTKAMLEIIIEQSNIPVVVDAGIGLPSHAAGAIELGADAVLINTAVAAADDPQKMAEAFRLAIRAAELGLQARPPMAISTASGTSPQNTFDIFR
ncbi:MAG: thiazole synthase [Victivallales bacterium]|jgi:thiazole synthase|nr:thiazole synthase [Victivallales bacterium]